MIVMEGLMLVPPERGTIIGRALWKPRYVVLGTGAALKAQSEALANTDNSVKSSSRKGLKATSSKPSLVDVTQQTQEERRLYISIFKAKGDCEFLSQFPVSAFKSCEIRAVQHRKQSPSLPTLMLEMKPDSPSDKQRKRRSSRTAGLTSKDPWGNILLFRTVPGDQHSIYNWQTTMKPLLTPDEPEESPLSPTSPSPIFINPFGSTKVPSNAASKGDFPVRPSTQQQSSYSQAPPPRERPSALISPSPSLRSRRSDLSSQSSSLHPTIGFTSSHPQTYGTLPSDLPSPASTSGYEPQLIEGWTSAQGRSSALSSHTRGSNSIASAVAPFPGSIGSSPPGPRETILDRAFQLRYIPGSERVPEKDDEKVSSIARFEALMREADERKQARLTSQSSKEAKDWDLDEELEESDVGEVEDDEDDDAEGLEMSDHEIAIPTPAQRALEYISGRKPPPQTSRALSPTRSPPIPFLNTQAMSAFHGYPSPYGGLRPRTGTTSSRNGSSRPKSIALPSRSISTTAVPNLRDASSSSNTLLAGTDPREKRRSSTSVKRLSFTEFAKRLSSTSSLLLVQTNASSSSGRDGSRRGSSEYGAEEIGEERLGIRGGGGPAMMGSGLESRSERDKERDKRCGWRGSVGVFGSEGGFL